MVAVLVISLRAWKVLYSQGNEVIEPKRDDIKVVKAKGWWDNDTRPCMR